MEERKFSLPKPPNGLRQGVPNKPTEKTNRFGEANANASSQPKDLQNNRTNVRTNLQNNRSVAQHVPPSDNVTTAPSKTNAGVQAVSQSSSNAQVASQGGSLGTVSQSNSNVQASQGNSNTPRNAKVPPVRPNLPPRPEMQPRSESQTAEEVFEHEPADETSVVTQKSQVHAAEKKELKKRAKLLEKVNIPLLINYGGLGICVLLFGLFVCLLVI